MYFLISVSFKRYYNKHLEARGLKTYIELIQKQ